MAKKRIKKTSPFLKEDWSHESLDESWDIIKKLASDKYGLTFYTPNFEVVGFEDMLHIYTGSLPIMYDHWSFGKSYIELHKRYMADRMGVAYEVIFNTNPALCYLLEHNSPTMQGLVMAHASVGHSAFFKNNVHFKEMTNAATIIPFLKNGRDYIKECEEKYGAKNVEVLLDACHALSFYGIDRMPKMEKTNKQKELARHERLKAKDEEYDKALKDIIIPTKDMVISKNQNRMREENILKFISKYSPALKQWQRDIISIYCQIQQYLYPQMLTKTMNEGFASFWHHTIMHDLIDMGYIEAGGALEFMHSHCSVLRQPEFDERGYQGFNPYKIGFEIFQDIKRICTDPTEEDKQWFPGLIGKNWIEEVKFAAYNFKDESFILQYLSPKVIRDLKLFVVTDDNDKDHIEITDIHDDDGYKQIRQKMSHMYNHFDNIPDLYIEGWDSRKSRTLFLCFKQQNNVHVKDDEATSACCLYIKQLWPFKIVLKQILNDGTTHTMES